MLQDAVLQWYKTFDSNLVNFSELSNGNVLSSVLHEIDSNWFTTRKNRVLLYRLHKLVLNYFEQILKQSCSGLQKIDFDRINEDAELLKLALLVIALAIQHNEKYVERINDFSKEDQSILMESLETILRQLKPAQGDIDVDLDYQPMDLSVPLAEYDLILNENIALLKKVRELERLAENTQSEGDSAKFDKGNLEEFRMKIEEMTNEKAELLETITRQQKRIASMSQKIDMSTSGVSKLRFKWEEFSSMADKLQRTEMLLEKYKRKADEAFDLERALRELERLLNEEIEKNRTMEAHFEKVAGFKDLIDTYKSQMASLEDKNSKLHMHSVESEFQLKRLHEKDAEISKLQERIQQLESQFSVNDHADVTMKEEPLAEYMDSELHDRVKQLEEHLAESNAQKGILQEDYQSIYSENLRLKHELEQNKAAPPIPEPIRVPGVVNNGLRKIASRSHLRKSNSMMSINLNKKSSHSVMKVSSSEKNRELNQKLLAVETENNVLSMELQQIKAEYDEMDRLVNSLQSKLEVFEHSEGNNDENTQALVVATQKLDEFGDQNSQLHGALKQAKELIVSQDKKIKELMSMDKEGFGDEMDQLKSELEKTKAELKRATQEVVDTRSAAKREQRLVMSAWYDLGVRVQRIQTFSGPVSWLGRSREKLVYEEALRRSYLL